MGFQKGEIIEVHSDELGIVEPTGWIRCEVITLGNALSTEYVDVQPLLPGANRWAVPIDRIRPCQTRPRPRLIQGGKTAPPERRPSGTVQRFPLVLLPSPKARP
jgi:hypothetical protein